MAEPARADSARDGVAMDGAAPGAAKLEAAAPRPDGLDLARIREDFPILKRKVRGERLVYLDSAATTQKPQMVLDAIQHYYTTSNANVHRAIHTLGEEATEAYEGVRDKVGALLGGVDRRGVVFTRNATESLNLMAYAWARPRLARGDEILITEMEHHSNLVPWLEAARVTGASIKVIPITDEGLLDQAAFHELLNHRTKILAFSHKSNVLGTVNPVREMTKAAHDVGALVVVDGAQAAPHMPVDLCELDVDAYALSAHKMLGPTGVGVLWAKREILEEMDPFLGGGEMIREVHLDRVSFNDVPWKFEAGTPNIAGVIGFGAAIDYLQELGIERLHRHEAELTVYARERLQEIQGLTVYGPSEISRGGGVVTFYDRDVHPHDLSTILDTYGVAIRAGHHCAQPLMRRLGVVATARASFYCYNGRDDVDALIDALRKCREYFGHES
jgi:cysteine desulfurase/selenocysteine lyase